jgi:hypothetical protein
MFNRKKEPLMTWMTAVPGLADDPVCQPQKASQFIPSWWKDMPQFADTDEPERLSLRRTRTAKRCPSFVEWFSTGVILPAWCDMAFKYNDETKTWAAATGANQSPYIIDIHTNDQMLNYMDYKHRGDKAQLVFKLTSPWFLKTPKGYSTLQLPLFYQNDRDWTVAAGTWHSDVLHDTNQQVFYFGDGKEVFIKKGQPLVHYVTYKRRKTDFITKTMNVDEVRLINSVSVVVNSKGSKGYSALMKD